MNVIAWARVSSREQREGYSLDAQIRAIRERAEKENWTIIREFTVAESAKRGADRAQFNEMMKWVRQNAKSQNIGAIAAHKLDRMCRNIRDAVRLQELEDDLGIKPLFVDNQFGPGAAGQLSFNVMASVAQYYSENLRSEVQKGQVEKAEQGWLPANAPFGYFNDTPDKNEPIKPDPRESQVVQRIFQMFETGRYTFDQVRELLASQGHFYCSSQPKFARQALSYILNNRFYVGEIIWHGRVLQGKHKPLVSRETFRCCQDILHGRNRRKSQVNLPMAGGLFRCKYCGQGITGELIRKKLKAGGVNEHVYYRCGNDEKEAGHPKVRWKSDALEGALLAQLNTLKLPSPEIASWFRTSLRAALADEVAFNQQRQSRLRKRESELQGQQKRLLDAFLSGDVPKDLYHAKAEELKIELETVRQQMAEETTINTSFVETAEKLFEMTQKAAESWLGSNSVVRRELLQVFSLNRELDEQNLYVDWAKPFAALAKQPDLKDGRGGGI